MEDNRSQDEVKMQRRQLFDVVFAATRDRESSEICAFARSGAIDHHMLGSLAVEGIPGEIPLPLSPMGAATLRKVSEQAPHGRGLKTVVNTAVRRAWQVDASKVSFPSDPRFLTQIEEIATRAVRELEPENHEFSVEARLYKLLLYERGGHFKVHRDTEKEPGMFATMVVQLPTVEGFEGGQLVVSHAGEKKVFNCTENATKRVCYTVFYADCEHTLEPVTCGSRLCLSFNLVRGSAVGDAGGGRGVESLLFRKVEDVLRPWLAAVEEYGDGDEKLRSEANVHPAILAIPLQHKYTRRNLSFEGLKGGDAALGRVLGSCLDRHLDVHLCLMTKTEMGTPADGRSTPCRKFTDTWTRGRWEMDDIYDEEERTSLWIGVDGEKLPIYPWFLDPKTELVLRSDEETFDKDPDEFKYEGYTGNEGPTLDFLYHRALVVVWPKSKAVPIVTAERRPNNMHFAAKVPEHAEVLSLLSMVERLHKEKDQHAQLAFRQLLAHCEKKYEGIWRRKGYGDSSLDCFSDDDGEDLLVRCNERMTFQALCVSSRLFEICAVAGDSTDTVRALKLHSEVFQVKKYDSRGRPSSTTPFFIGLRSASVCKSIAAAVHSHGWAACGEAVILLLQKNRLYVEGEYYVQLATELQQLGHLSEAAMIISTTLRLTSGLPRMGNLQSKLRETRQVIQKLCDGTVSGREIGADDTQAGGEGGVKRLRSN